MESVDLAKSCANLTNCEQNNLFTAILTRIDSLEKRFDAVEGGLKGVQEEVKKITIGQTKTRGRWSVAIDFYTLIIAGLSGGLVFLFYKV